MDQFVLRLVEQAGYFGIFVLMALENVFPPVPSELVMGLAGIEVAQGGMRFVPAVLIGSAGATIGNYFWYWIGAKFGHDRLGRFIEKHGRWLTLDHSDVEKLNRAFTRHGAAIVFFMRFVPGVRTMVSLPAGLFGMARWKFFLWTFAGSLLWNAAFAWAGYELGRRFEQIDRYVGPISLGVIGVILAIYLYRVIFWTPSGTKFGD